jgi:hypothetical protein
VDLDEISYGDNATQGRHDALIFNLIASTALKQLKFQVLRWMQHIHNSALLNNGLGEVNTADVTIETGLNYMRSMEGK